MDFIFLINKIKNFKGFVFNNYRKWFLIVYFALGKALNSLERGVFSFKVEVNAHHPEEFRYIYLKDSWDNFYYLSLGSVFSCGTLFLLFLINSYHPEALMSFLLLCFSLGFFVITRRNRTYFNTNDLSNVDYFNMDIYHKVINSRTDVIVNYLNFLKENEREVSLIELEYLYPHTETSILFDRVTKKNCKCNKEGLADNENEKAVVVIKDLKKDDDELIIFDYLKLSNKKVLTKKEICKHTHLSSSRVNSAISNLIVGKVVGGKSLSIMSIKKRRLGSVYTV